MVTPFELSGYSAFVPRTGIDLSGTPSPSSWFVITSLILQIIEKPIGDSGSGAGMTETKHL
jgi:hypothetical protein